MPIGQFSKSCRLSIKALRHYDQLGLLQPAYVDPESGYRYYEPKQARTALIISMLRAIDVPLPAIQRLLSGSAEQIASILEEEHERFLREVEKKQHALKTIERLMRTGLVAYEVQTRNEPARTMIGIAITTSSDRHVIDSLEAVERLFAGMQAAKLPIEDPIMGRVQFGEDESLRVEILAPIAAGREPFAGAEIIRLEETRVAWTMHRGPYEDLGLAHHALFSWAREHGHEVGDVLETYVSDPKLVPAEELLTEVFIPLSRR